MISVFGSVGGRRRPPTPPAVRDHSLAGTGGGNMPNPHAEAIETIVRLIAEHVAPDMWRDAGGTIGSIREFNHRLLITATPEMHAEIAALLELLRTELLRKEK